MKLVYKTNEDKASLEALFHIKFDQQHLDYMIQKVETSFGDVHVTIVGNINLPPLVVLDSVYAYTSELVGAFAELLDRYVIYFVDVNGIANQGEQTQLCSYNNSYGQWMFELLSRLNIREVTLLGISFGGFVSWKSMTFESRHIACAYLVAPAGIIPAQLEWPHYDFLVPAGKYDVIDEFKFVQQYIESVSTDRLATQSVCMTNLLKASRLDCSSLPIMSEYEGDNISVPIGLIAADNDVLYSGPLMIHRAKSMMPTLRKTLLLKDSNHIPNISGYREIISMIKSEFDHMIL